MRAWGQDALPINKMAVWLSHLGYTQICVARGIVSWERKDTAAGKLQLWCSERDHDYWLYARKTVRDDMEVPYLFE